MYCGAGYVVVFSNPRGSSGSGEAWARAIRGPGEAGPGWGSVDYEDCMAVIEEAVRRFDFIDGERLGVIGGSYGGYMTSWIVSHTDRFKAAVSERAVNQLRLGVGLERLRLGLQGVPRHVRLRGRGRLSQHLAGDLRGETSTRRS